MPLDGAFLYKLKNELSTLNNAHLDKIFQPSRDELVFLLRSKEGTHRLLLSAKQGASRVHLTDSKPENPQTPPMFCMLLRKYLGAARLVNIEQVGLERVITFIFSSTNEMGDIIYPRIICELIGSQPNIILTDENGTIIDAIRRSDLESSARIIQPGAHYIPPEATGKINILSVKTADITEKILALDEYPLWKAILETLEGFSPLTAREVAFRICGDFEKTVTLLTEGERMNITGTLNSILRDISENTHPVVIYDEKSIPKDFSYTEICQYKPELSCSVHSSFSQALDAFYTKKENERRIRNQAQDLFKILSVLITRTERKTALRKKDLEKCTDREKFRIYGELIKANLYKISSGQKNVTVENYYDENCAPITIPLNPALSPALNADHYFKEYKKSYTAEKVLTNLIEQDKEDLKYFDSVLDSLSRAESISDLNEIRDELSELYIVSSNNKSTKNNKLKDNFREYFTENGFRILVGKNNRQNDRLTLNTANKNDIWFHTKNIPGSHTVLITDGKEPKEEDIVFAAGIAAFHSKAQNSSQVPVDYTLIKYVKKPGGAKPGMVIYTHERTLFVTPKTETELDESN